MMGGGDVNVHGYAACDIRYAFLLIFFCFRGGGGGGSGGWGAC